MEDFIQPIHLSNEGVFNAQSGKLINILNPTAEMILLADIASGLANVCRFGGQIPEHYSVAEHTVLVYHLCPTELKPAALLHDASEAYLGDVIKPLKNLLGAAYTDIEDRFTNVIFEKYGVPLFHLAQIKDYDMLALEIENSYFRYGTQDLINHQFNYKMIHGFDVKPRLLLLEILNQHFLQKEIN